MVQPTYVTALQELKTLPKPEDQLRLLRLLKNHIVGHGQRKDVAVRLGLLDPLANILRVGDKSNGKKPIASSYSIDSTIEHDIRMQAILIIGSLANGIAHTTLSICIYFTANLLPPTQLVPHSSLPLSPPMYCHPSCSPYIHPTCL